MAGQHDPDSQLDSLTGEQISMLFTFRRAMLQFTKWSEHRVRTAGLTPQQYLLLLAIRARDGDEAPSVGRLAADLLIRPNSANELINRAEAIDLVRRARDTRDQRAVRVSLSQHGSQVLDSLATEHMVELERAAQTLSISEEFLARLSAKFLGPSAASTD
jgi:DNA-binding MarR family transcriptional regulator